MPQKLINNLLGIEEEEEQQKPKPFSRNVPPWAIQRKDGSFRVADNVFAEDFCADREIMCVNGLLYGNDGQLDDKAVEAEIQAKIKAWCDVNLAYKTNALLRAIKNECYIPAPEVDENKIHCLDGTVILHDGTYTFAEREFAMNRISVNLADIKNKKPAVWLKFLEQLLEPEDILTLQEFLGYCLIPTTKAQVMLLLLGKGGEGKSRIGVILNALFGMSMAIGKLNDIQEDKFAGAQLEGKLLFLDDDLKGTKLKDTDFLKSVITAEIPMQVQRKGVNMYSVKLYCTLMAFGNQAMSSLFDRSDGFYRRQVVLRCKRKPEDRVDDRDLSAKLLAEKNEIFLWMLQGLMRLRSNSYNFTRSEKAIAYMRDLKNDDNNILSFLEDDRAVNFGASYDTTSTELYSAYCHWCSLNAEQALSQRTFLTFLKNQQEEYGIKHDCNIVRPGRRVRGFKGVKVVLDVQSIII